jgi:hypothetical protein
LLSLLSPGENPSTLTTACFDLSSIFSSFLAALGSGLTSAACYND